MVYHRLLKVFCLLLIGLGITLSTADAPPVMAQENLLRDPGFENTAFNVVANADNRLCTVPADWRGWITETPRTAEWQNRIPDCTGQMDKVQGFVRSGNRSQEFSRGFATFTAAVYQTVSVPAAGTNVVGSAYYVMDAGSGAQSQVRVGIDPDGGSNPLAGNIVWSSWGNVRRNTDGFGQLTVNATSTGTSVTFFVYVTQSTPTDPNKVFIDDASLTIGGAGGSVPNPQNPAEPQQPQPPAQPPSNVANFVAPQGAQPDGSIVHTVVEGDTLSAIATAYRVPIDTLRELNPQIGRGSFLTIGQQLLIQPAPQVTPTPVPTATPEAPPEPVVTLPPRPARQLNAGWLAVPITPPTLPEPQGQTPDSITVAQNAPPSQTPLPATATDIPATATSAPIEPTTISATETPASIFATNTPIIEPTNTLPATPTNIPQTQGNTSLFATATSHSPAIIPTETPAPTEPITVAQPAVIDPTATQQPTNTDAPAIVPTNTDVPAQPTVVAMNPPQSTTGVCVTFFDDMNRNRLADMGETPLIGGVITLRLDGQDQSAFLTTGDPAPYCFLDLAPGNYVVFATPPDGYGMTTPEQFQVRVLADITLDVAFGAAQGVETPPLVVANAQPDQPAVIVEQPATNAPATENNSLLANIGIIILALAGVTLVTGVIGTILISRR